MEIYLAGQPHRPNNKFNFNLASNILNDMKYQLDKYNKATLDLLTGFSDVPTLKTEQKHEDYDHGLKKLDDNYIVLRTHNLLEKLKTSNIFIKTSLKSFVLITGSVLIIMN